MAKRAVLPREVIEAFARHLEVEEASSCKCGEPVIGFRVGPDVGHHTQTTPVHGSIGLALVTAVSLRHLSGLSERERTEIISGFRDDMAREANERELKGDRDVADGFRDVVTMDTAELFDRLVSGDPIVTVRRDKRRGG